MDSPFPATIRRFLPAVACYLVIAVLAWRESFSTSGWLILGLAPMLWLDRHVFRLLPWPNALPLGGAVLVRLGFGVAVSAPLWLGGRRFFSFHEAVYLGLLATWCAFLAGLCLEGLFHLANRIGKPAPASSRFPLRNVIVVLALVPLVVFLSPLVWFHPVGTSPFNTPSQIGLPYDDVRLHTADGLELVAWLVPHPRPRGSIIFCHGHGTSRQHVFVVLERLHALRLNVLAFDFRGCGESPGHTACFGLREVPDVQAAEAFLTQSYPNEPIFIFGVSYGAAVSLQALPQLSRVRAAWIESSFSRLSDAADHRFANLNADGRRRLIGTYSVLTWLDTGTWPLDANPIDHLHETNVPILFCHGTDDPLIPFAQAQELYTTYRGSKSCYWVEHGGHDVQTVGGLEYVERLNRFFNDQLRLTAEASH